VSTTLRGLEVVEALAGMRQPASLREIAARVGVSEAQTFRLLRALEQAHYVDHLGRSGYRIGSRSVALGTIIGPRPAFLRAVQPAIGRLAARTREGVVVHLRTGDYRVLVLGIPGSSAPTADAGGALGERSRLGVGASGRVILAYLPAAERGTAHPSARLLTAIRDRGYEMSFGENHPGINGISGPLLTTEGKALGSVTIAGPATRLTEAAMVRLSGALLATCRELSPTMASLLGPEPGATVAALDL